MSDCCAKPYIGVNHEYYNPSEVRLYGRPAYCPSRKKIQEDVNSKLRKLKATEDPEVAGKISQFASDYISEYILGNLDIELMEQEEKSTIGLDGSHADEDDEKRIEDAETYKKVLKLAVKGCYILIYPGPNITIKNIGIIYGYAYEGHCYKLPKPQIMYLPRKSRRIEEGDCGCDCGYVHELGYAVWSIDKLERVVALDVRSDDLKTLVLEENLPGKRSPLAYSQVAALAPSRGRE